MIKFEVWYDAYQTKIMACSSEETKENNNVECYYKVGKYIKKEIEDIQEENNKQKEVLDKIKKYCNNRLDYYQEMRTDYMKEFDGYAENDNENILELLEEIE